MKFYSLTKKDNTDDKTLKAHFDSGHRIGAVCVADDYIFVKKRLRTYFIAYKDADRIYRRVRTYMVNMCCEQGDLRFDYIIIYKDGNELIEAELPGEKAARMLLDEIKEKAPSLNFAAPERPQTEPALESA